MNSGARAYIVLIRVANQTSCAVMIFMSYCNIEKKTPTFIAYLLTN